MMGLANAAAKNQLFISGVPLYNSTNIPLHVVSDGSAGFRRRQRGYGITATNTGRSWCTNWPENFRTEVNETKWPTTGGWAKEAMVNVSQEAQELWIQAELDTAVHSYKPTEGGGKVVMI